MKVNPNILILFLFTLILLFLILNKLDEPILNYI